MDLSDKQKYAFDVIPNLVVLDKLIYDCSTNNNIPKYNWEKRFEYSGAIVETKTYRGLFVCDCPLSFTTKLSSFYPVSTGNPADTEDKSITAIDVSLTDSNDKPPYIYAVFTDETAANDGFSILVTPEDTSSITSCTIYEALF